VKAATVAMVLWWSVPASADGPVTLLRLATAAPDGSAWARLLKSTADKIAEASGGGVRIKWYLGGIAGDELETSKRMNDGQLDGVASGGPICQRIAPTIRALGLPGLYQNRGEVAFVAHKLRPQLVDEMKHAGFTLLFTSNLGPTVLFARKPINDLAELRATPLWTWEINDIDLDSERALGLRALGNSLSWALKSYQTGAVDGIITVPAAALAYQWSTQTRYLMDLKMSFVNGCFIIVNRSFERLTPEQQRIVREEWERADAGFEDLGRRMDDELLGGLFAKQGLTPVPVSEAFRQQYLQAAKPVREKLVPKPLLARVMQLLTEARGGRRAK
jgi:TRAP-type C4-dicarboxylate transport system substrate-binding protein